MIDDTQIDEAIKALENRKVKLTKLRKLNSEVTRMEIHLAKAPQEIRDAMEIIERIVTEHFQLTGMDMRSSRRPSYITAARHLIFFLDRSLTKASLQMIADVYGRRDHSTVLHGYGCVTDRMETEPQYKALVGRLRDQCQKELNEKQKSQA